MPKITEVDKNFKNKAVFREDMKLYSVKDKPFRLYGLYDIFGKNGEDTVQIQLGDQLVRKNSTFLHQKLMVQIIDIFGDGHAGNQLGDRQPFHKYSAPYHEKKI